MNADSGDMGAMSASGGDMFSGALGPGGSVLTLAQASAWASERVGRNITPSNIAYLVNYGRVPRANAAGPLMVRAADLERYYAAVGGRRESLYKRRLGGDLNWRLSFEEFKESETTKHVHRLHPYKGKFIPQLVEYFLDAHTDDFKTEARFAPGDAVLDPFCGSGTTLAQASELGIHAVGVDASVFNAMISNLKLSRVNLAELAAAAKDAERRIAANAAGQRARELEDDLLAELKAFNAEFFPSPEFRRRARSGEIDEKRYGDEKAAAFLPTYHRLLKKHGASNALGAADSGFMASWYLESVHEEINSAKAFIDGLPDALLRDTLRLVLSRAARSSRATTHYDLATLVKPVTETYYCGKHGKICKPLFSMLGWWRRYANDTVKRMAQFDKLRTDTAQVCLTGDSRNIDILSELDKAGKADGDAGRANRRLAELVRRRGFRGIFSSPPYVGLIDYHEQHAYAYELFGLPRNDAAEIGPLSGGRGRKAQDAYVQGISDALANCMRYMADDCDIFLVANDKFGLYPRIADIAGLAIAKEYRRPVLNRAEGNKGAYAETIFHMKRARRRSTGGAGANGRGLGWAGVALTGDGRLGGDAATTFGWLRG